MFRATSGSLRYVQFYRGRATIPVYNFPITSMFPLIDSNNLLSKPHNHFSDYEGRREHDPDHPLPMFDTRSAATTRPHRWTAWDQFLNPSLTTLRTLQPTPEYAGMRAGRLIPNLGWLKPGRSYKFTCNYWLQRKHKGRIGVWLERSMTPRWVRAPRVSASGPRARYTGKLRYSPIKLSKIVWAIDAGMLNPNETITMYHLFENGIIGEEEVIWPGFKLIRGDVEKLNYPISLEVQRASKKVLDIIEAAGGQVTCTYVSPEGIHQELYPEDYPEFLEQHMPDRLSFENVSSRYDSRGFLAEWAEDTNRYANPDAGRRLSHYVRPPYKRDFPATFEEYERVKHHQKWHLNQAGSGTVLPFTSLRSNQRPRTRQLS